MAAETAIDAAIANQRPLPLANKFLPTNSTLLLYLALNRNLRYLSVDYCSGVRPKATKFDAVERTKQAWAVII